MTNLATPVSNTYSAVITTVRAINDIKGKDRIVSIPLFGQNAIAQKGWAPGDLCVWFPPEVQFSAEFAHHNNLNRDHTLNADPAEKGYLEANRRLRCIKFAGERSDSMVMPLASLAFTGFDIGQLRDGDTFDTLNDIEIVRKYEVPVKPGTGKPNQAPKQRRIDKKHFPEHIGTDNYWRNLHRLEDTDEIIVSQKLHGTSVRIGHTLANKKPPTTRRERFNHWVAKKLGLDLQLQQYENVYGSKQVIKDANNPDQQHFYETDIWTQQGSKLDGVVPQGFMIYGELIGWTTEGSPIQKDYTYNLAEKEAELYIYRVAIVNPEGMLFDLSWDQMVQFCNDRLLKHVPLLWRGPAAQFNVDEWMDSRYYPTHRNAVPLGPVTKEIVDEGVVVRREGLTPTLLKAKSPKFLIHETGQLDTGEVDLESSQAAA